MKFLLFLFVLFPASLAFSMDITEPVVNTNVHVLRNIAPSECPRSWRGNVAPAIESATSDYGQATFGVVGVQSCVHCAFDSSSNDCVCATCYGYYN